MANAPQIILFEMVDGCVEEVELPSRFEVCSRCEGHGTHEHPAFDNGITSSEWNGPDWDDESRETYMRGGYDVQCEACKGARVVSVLDRERCTAEQLKLWEQQEREDADYEAECRMEARMGA